MLNFRASKSLKLTLNPSFCIRKMVLATTSLYLGGIGGSVWHPFQMAKLRGVRNGGDHNWDDPPSTLFVVTCDPHVIYGSWQLSLTRPAGTYEHVETSWYKYKPKKISTHFDGSKWHQTVLPFI